MYVRKKAKNLFGFPFLIFLCLAFSSWGVHLAIGPLYICDVILVGTAVSYLVKKLPSDEIVKHPPKTPLTIQLSFVLVVLAAVRLLFSFEQSPTFIDALRDAAPFAYGLIGLVIFRFRASQYQEMKGSAESGFRLFNMALNIHLYWVLISILLTDRLGWDLWPQLFTYGLLRTRPDIDAAFLGVLVAVRLHDLLANRASPITNLLHIVLATAGALLLSSRAGLIGFVVIVGVAIFQYIVCDLKSVYRKVSWILTLLVLSLIHI